MTTTTTIRTMTNWPWSTSPPSIKMNYSLMDEWQPFLCMRVVISWKNWKGWKMKKPSSVWYFGHSRSANQLNTWVGISIFRSVTYSELIIPYMIDQRLSIKNIFGTTRGQDQLVTGQCWCKVPFEDILQNTVSRFFLARSQEAENNLAQ